jgi:hypothetical protein
MKNGSPKSLAGNKEVINRGIRCPPRKPMVPQSKIRERGQGEIHHLRNKKRLRWRCCWTELCGYLGQPRRIQRFLRALTDIYHSQSFIQPGSWKAKTLRTTFCSTLTGCCPYRYTTRRHSFHCGQVHAWLFIVTQSHRFVSSTTQTVATL